jgi:uncharacterized protein (TIGR03435 family)
MKAAPAVCAVLSAFFPTGAFPQQPVRPDPEVPFEVATVRINTDVNAGGYMSGGPGSKDPTLIAFTHVRMGGIVRRAFGVNASYELVAPSGLPDAAYDIRAKIPPGTDELNFERMLQNLLIERFGMEAHRETREVAGYELTVAKSGLKLRAAEQAATPQDPDVPVGARAMVEDRSGEPQLAPGQNGRVVVRLSDGRFRHTARMQTLADVAAMCARELGKPVVDGTGLTGVYDFNIDFMRAPDEPDQKMDESEVPFLTAFQTQSGLRLQAKKVRAEVVVIDRMGKSPTGN